MKKLNSILNCFKFLVEKPFWFALYNTISVIMAIEYIVLGLLGDFILKIMVVIEKYWLYLQ